MRGVALGIARGINDMGLVAAASHLYDYAFPDADLYLPSGWTAQSGIYVMSHLLQENSGSGCAVLTTLGGSLTDARVTATIGAWQGSNYPSYMIRIRSNSSTAVSDSGYAVWISASDSTHCTFYLRAGGTNLFSVAGTYAIGDTIAVQAKGTAITVYHNGTQILSATDSGTASGYASIRFLGVTGGLSHFTVDAA